MILLLKKIDIQDFFFRLKTAETPILFLDYDGTIAPYNIDRDQAYPYPGVRRLLTQLIKNSSTRLVVVSGRPLKGLKKLLHLHPLPELWGSHGWEREKPGGEYQMIKPFPGMAEGIEMGKTFALELLPKEAVEIKPVSVAAHWRGKPLQEKETIFQTISAGWAPLTDNYPLEIHPFHEGIELRPVGRSKGDVVIEVLKESPPESMVAYLGDDLTDEEGFKYLGEQGLKILVGKQPYPTLADIEITPPDEVIHFLTSWLQATETNHGR